MRQASLEPRLEYVTCASPAGLHRMAYWEWGDPANDQVLVCVHGLTRTGRDFDALAQRLAGRYRVVCPTWSAAAVPTGWPIPRSTPCRSTRRTWSR